MRPATWAVPLRTTAVAVVLVLSPVGAAAAAGATGSTTSGVAASGGLAAGLAAVAGRVASLAVASGEPSTVSVPATAGERRVRLRAAVRDLPVGTETRTGYEREKFRDWYDANGDCQDTRDEVLDQESRTAVSGCDITTGSWYSYYDGRTWTSDDDVDIDHLVALAEGWDSGARRWTGGTRDRYANDLGDRRTLVAVTDSVNQSKGDQDIAEWLPQRGHCRYVREWVAVKTRWQLRVDRAEKRRLVGLAGDCTNSVLRVRLATVHRR